MFFLFRIAITTVVVVAIAHLIPGLEVKNYTDAVLFGLLLGLINAIVRPILVLLTIPVTVVTLGLFLLIINAFTFWLPSTISYGILIHTIEAILIARLIVCVTGIFTNRLIWDKGMYR